jgi:hypothetical protein
VTDSIRYSPGVTPFYFHPVADTAFLPSFLLFSFATLLGRAARPPLRVTVSSWLGATNAYRAAPSIGALVVTSCLPTLSMRGLCSY